MAAVSYQINRIGAEWNDRVILRLLPGNVKYHTEVFVEQGSVLLRVAAEPQKRFLFFNPKQTALREAEGYLNTFLSGQKAYKTAPKYIREPIEDLLDDWKHYKVRTICATHEPRLSNMYNR